MDSESRHSLADDAHRRWTRPSCPLLRLPTTSANREAAAALPIATAVTFALSPPDEGHRTSGSADIALTSLLLPWRRDGRAVQQRRAEPR